MGSLFDLAAGLSQYEEDRTLAAPVNDGATPRHLTTRKLSHSSRADAPTANNQDADGVTSASASALSLLDETLLTLYGAWQPQTNLSPSRSSFPQSQHPIVGLTTQRSAPQLLLPTRQATNEPSTTSQTPPRLAATALQNVFAQSVTFRTDASEAKGARTIPPPPSLPPPSSLNGPASTKTIRATLPGADDPDVTARRALRDVHEELEQLPLDAMASPRRLQRLQRSLSDKYLMDRLSKLPSTPFVQLARRKTQQKIDLLGEKMTTTSIGATTVTAAGGPSAPLASAPASSIFPADQHAMLTKLATIPDAHVAKLSTTQRQMVQFAKRYDKILRLSSDELRKLPVSQAQLLQQLQRQLEASRQLK